MLMPFKNIRIHQIQALSVAIIITLWQGARPVPKGNAVITRVDVVQWFAAPIQAGVSL